MFYCCRFFMRNFFSFNFLSRLMHGRYYGLVAADSLRNVALSMIAFFVPLYLLEKGYSFFYVGFYYLFFYAACIFAHFYLIRIINRIGIKRGLVISYLADIAFYVILSNYDLISGQSGKILFLALLFIPSIIATVSYWTAHHVYFFIASHSRHEGKKLGFLYSIPNALGIVSPFLGGALITCFGFEATFLVSILLMSLASFVIFMSKDVSVEMDCKIGQALDLKRDDKNWLFFIDGANYFVSGLIWPMYMFVMSINFLSIGFVYIFCNIGYSASCLISGKLIDKKGSRNLGRIGAVGHAATLALRAFTRSVFSMSTVLVFGGIFGAMMQVSLDSGFYKHSHENFGSALMNREFYMHLGRVFMILLFLFCLMLFSARHSLMIVLLCAALLTFVLNFFIKKDKVIIE